MNRTVLGVDCCVYDARLDRVIVMVLLLVHGGASEGLVIERGLLL